MRSNYGLDNVLSHLEVVRCGAESSFCLCGYAERRLGCLGFLAPRHSFLDRALYLVERSSRMASPRT